MVTRTAARTGLAALSLLAVGAALLGLAGPALACDCPEPPPPQEELERVDAVFAGEVTELHQVGDEPPGPWLDARVEVAEVWKGEIAEVEQVRTHAHGATCGYGFESGRVELIYAVVDDNGRLTTDLCSRTTPLDGAEEDLAALGDGSEPRPGSGIEEGAGAVASALPVALTATIVVVALALLGGWRLRRRQRPGAP